MDMDGWILDQFQNDGEGGYDGRLALPLWIADQVRNDVVSCPRCGLIPCQALGQALSL